MQEFDDLVDQTAVSTLELVLGEGTAKALIHHVGESASRSDGRPFSEGLKRITGGGAITIEKLIVKSLYSKLGFGFGENAGEFSFEESLRRARELMVHGGRAF